MTDFHSHILPGMDDGADRSATSVEMLTELKKQGIGSVVLTPHFYGNREDPDTFLKRRAASIERLQRVYRADLPAAFVGAEVAYFRGIGHSKGMRGLTIIGTDTILVEMPFDTWSENVIDDVKRLVDFQGLHVVLAHIERYIAYQKPDTIDSLLDFGIRIQSNASYFTDFFKKHKAISLLSDHKIQFIGSDSHNMKERKPNLGPALMEIDKRLGREYIDYLNNNSKRVLAKALTIV